MTAADETERKIQLRDFQQNAHRLLTEDDRDYLHYVMKEYQTYKSVEKLVMALKSCLDTPRKLDLLVDIRNLIPKAHLSKFDSLVPYHRMAHPTRPPNQISADRKTQSLNLKNGELTELQQNGEYSSVESTGSFKVVTLVKMSPDQVLGFSIRGGRDHDSSVSVSQIDAGSQAEKQGLQVGDQIIEVNGIDFERIASNSAINLLSSLSKIKLVVRSPGKMPDFGEGSPRKNPWDVKNGKVSPEGNMENESLQNSSAGSGSNLGITLQPNSHLLNSSDERRVNLVVEPTQSGLIGFNLRGGSEYGLGIYVSGVDPDSLAEQAGFRVGDQILNVNGRSFEIIKHKDAVDFIKRNKHIIVTLKAVGKLPEAKHYTSEISWILPDGTVVREGKEHFSRSLSMPPSPVSPMELSTTSTQFPDLENNNREESHKPDLRECGVQTPDLSLYNTLEPVSMSTPDNSPMQDSIPVRDDAQELQRTTSSKSVTTTSSASSGDTEKRHSTYSSYSVDSVNSREGFDKRYSTSSTVNREDVIMMATASDSETIKQDDKKKVKKSKSFLQKHGDKIRSKLSFRKKSKPKTELKAPLFGYNWQLPVGPSVFEKGFGTQLMLHSGGPSKQQILLYIEERAKKILVVDEYNALIGHIKQYFEDVDVESLVNKLLAILDKPEKALLLRDVRALISPYDLGRFDAMVSAHEKGALEYLSVCVPGSPTIIPTVAEKPKRQLVAAIQDSRGGFQIRSNEELERLRREREEQGNNRAQVAWLGGNILDRQKRQGTSDYYAVQSTTPEPIEMGPVRDTGPSTAGPISLDVPIIQVSNGQMNDEEAVEFHRSSNTLMVPDRVAIEYKEDDDEDDVMAGMGGHQSAFIPVPSIAVSTSPSEVNILLHKNRTSLGISISGGKGSKTQPEIRVEKIFPGGAASDDGRLKSGDEILCVDGTSLQDVTHAEAVDIIRRSYNNKTKDAMEIIVIPKQ